MAALSKSESPDYMEGIDWEATLYKVLKKCSENKLPIKQVKATTCGAVGPK